MVEPLVIPFVVVRDELAPGRPEERAAVMDEDPDVSQASVLGIGGVPHELGDPRPVGLGADARDLTAAAGPVHQDQHGEAGQAAWRPELDREEVGGGEHVPVGRETLPRNRELALTDVATISRRSTIARAIIVIEAAGARSSSKRLTNRAERVSTESWELKIR